MWIAVLAACGCLAACGGPGASSPPKPLATAPTEPTRDGAEYDEADAHDRPDAPTSAAVERARWRDVDAAARAAVSEVGMAIERTESPGAFERIYILVGVRAEPGALRVRAPSSSNPDDMTTIDPGAASTSLQCRVGRFGDAARERTLIVTMRAWRSQHTR